MADKQKQLQNFLAKIAQIESSGGQNTNHPEIQQGIHAGDSAIGRYGLMPNTVREVINRMRRQGTLSPELQQLEQHPDLKSALEQNPQLEDQLAQSLAQRVLQRQGDEDKAAYSWHKGHNLTPDQIGVRPYLEDTYVKKFKGIKNEGEK